MSFYKSVVRPLMFMLPAETAHNLAMSVISRGWVQARSFTHPILAQTLFGQEFRNPIGLAAGFDKHAVALNHWHRLGFGYAEIGTVTWHPQGGNPQPRLFRIPSHQALINRFGFNNEGARIVATRLAASRPRVPIGVNLGKSKVTELADAAKDYRDSFKLLHRNGAYFVVNVSSPNTPGLRSLQERGPLMEILTALKEVDPAKPMFIKVAPDLEYDALDELVQVAVDSKIAGIIATNTTISREAIPSGVRNRDEGGGLSGVPLKNRADMVLRHLAKACGDDMVLIGVGGISTAGDMFDKIALGAHLVQVYTGWIYGGPQFVPNLLEDFVSLLEKHGIKSLEELRGSAL